MIAVAEDNRHTTIRQLALQSAANDETSGPVGAAILARDILNVKQKLEAPFIKKKVKVLDHNMPFTRLVFPSTRTAKSTYI
jgi:hypothetical protein